MASKTFKVTLVHEGAMCFIPVPFDPKPLFGKVRAPVRVTLNGHTYRSTIASMGGAVGIPLRKSNREAAGLEGSETLEVKLELDTDERTVEPPPDLAGALRGTPTAWDRWTELSYTYQREYVEALADAKRPETRARRLEAAVRAIVARPPKRQSR
ncbi:MAG: YdeI/OmpD-associated family protein [Acidobacteriota bacterium]